MRTYILKRLVQIVPTVLMITFVVFVMMRSDRRARGFKPPF